MDQSTIGISLRKVFDAVEKLGRRRIVFSTAVLQPQSGSAAFRKPCLNL